MSLISGLLGGLIGKADFGRLITRLLLGKREVEKLKALPLGESMELPRVRTNLPGGYYELTMHARKLDD